MTKQLALAIALLVCLGNVADHTRAQALDQRVAELSKQISDGLTENQKRTIAVVEFVDLKGNVTDFGRFLAEELITRLYQTKKFKVIERQLLNKVVTEQKLSLTGMIDQTSAQKLGRLLGVDAIASGTITDLGKSLRINARLIDTSTAEIFAVASTEVVRDDAVAKLIGGADSPSAQGDGSAGTKQQLKSKAQKVEAQFFTFELHRCRLSGTTVACDLTITNNDRDRELAICAGGVIFDEAGNRYNMYSAQLANDEGSIASAYLISGVATKARVTFEKVSPTASKITLMSLRICGGRGAAEFQLQYRNISLREGIANVDSDGLADRTPTAEYGRQETIRVPGNREWTDTGIDVVPGMRLEVTASGRVYITSQNSTANQVLGGIINRNGSRLPPRSVSTSALLAKIRYARGGESNVLRVGDKNTLVVEQGETGRLLFGIDDKNVNDNSGNFTVRLKW